MAVLFGLFAAITANRNSSVGVVLLLALTFLLGLMLGPILQHALHLRNGGQIVGLAAGGTGIIFLTLAGIATTTKKDFSFMGKFLMVGIILLIVASLANIFLQIPAMTLAMSAVGVILFSGFILYDVSRIVNGGETNYIMATLSLYMSIYNLFTSLLQLLMGLLGGNND
jgi:modulator of FtsH protease